MAGMTEQEADAFLGGPPPAPTAGAQPGAQTPPTPSGPQSMTSDEADAFLGSVPPSTSRPMGRGLVRAGDMDAFLANTTIGRVLDSVGQGIKEGFGTEDIGMGKPMAAALTKGGIFNDVEKGQKSILRTFNEALIRPAAAGLDTAMRAGSALFGGVERGVGQIGAEIGGPALGRDFAGIVESEGGSSSLHGVPHAPLDLDAAHEAGAIGAPESVWKGTAAPEAVPAPVAAPEAAGGVALPAAEPEPAPPSAAPEQAAAEPATATPAPPADIHAAARQIAPDTFTEYDALAAHKDILRQAITDQTAELQRNAEAQAPHQAEIADLEARMQDTTPRLAKKYQARLDELLPERDAFLQNEDGMALITRDTPEIAALRQQMAETDYRMRDLAPDVTAAYRKAAGQFPAPEEETPVAAEPAPPSAEEIGQKPSETPPPAPIAVPEEVAQSAAPAQAQPAADTATPPVASIADDVAAKLRAAGRPADEADASGQVTEALWKTRADAFDGRKGTAEEMYAREAPDIRAGKQSSRQLELAQSDTRTGGAQGKIRLATDGRAVITLMRTADASTFLHETGHDWLERMMQDARDPDAPQHMRDDAATVRNYLGVAEGETIPTRAHEKFARSFERYFMEGRAPSRALAGVFEKFKTWLTGIYQTVAKLRAPITPDIRDVFDRLLTREPEAQAIVAPEAAAEDAQGQLPIQAPLAKPTPLFPKLPKPPIGMTNWIRKLGGVRDAGGEITQLLDKRKLPGLVNNENGMSLDDMTHKLWEDGYLPEFNERPTIEEMLTVLEGDMNGHTPRYSEQDRAQLDAYNNAVSHNDEVERLSHEHGIDTTGMTREQFFEELSKKVSEQKQAEEIRSQESAHEAEFGEAAAEAREHEESRLGHWDGDAFYGIDGPRTTAELEAAYHGQADTSGPAGQSTANGGDGGLAGRSTPSGQKGSGPRDGGLGDAGRAGPPPSGTSGNPAATPAADAGGVAAGSRARPAADRPAGPGDLFGRADTGLVDKAGNIRLDNLNQPEDVNAVIRQTAADNDDFTAARRGVISDAQVVDLADALGMTAGDINQRKLGQAFNAEQVMAARNLLVQSAQSVRDAMIKAANGSDADVMAYGEARARHLMIQEQVSGITAEAGRALRAFRAFGEDGAQVQAIGEFLQANTGRTLNQMRQEARAGALLDTPQQVSKFVQDANKPTFGDMAMEYWINGLISGPATHTTYAIGNAMLAVWKAVPETAVAAAIGKARGLLGDDGPRVEPGEVAAGLYGILRGQRDGIRAAYKAGLSGLTTELPGETEGGAQTSFLAMQRGGGGAIPDFNVGGVRIPLGSAIRLPSRGVAVIHSYFRAIGYSEAIAQLAYRKAAAEGLDDAAFTARVSALTTNPPPSMMEAARTSATDQTMMNGGGEFTRKFAELTNISFMSAPWLKIVDPFVKIGSNVMGQALMERSPLGVLDPAIRENLMGRNGPVARDQQIARMAVGSALGAGIIGMAAQGQITGGGPSDPKESAMWRLAGNQPYSARIGDTWYGYHRLGPLAMIMGVAADMHDIGAAMETKDVAHVANLVVASLAKSLLDESFMKGPADLIQAIENHEVYGARYVRDQLATLIPFSTGMAQVARAADPYAREARTTLDAIRARVPGLSQGLYPRRDIWGAPMPNPDDFGADGLTSIAEKRISTDPVNQAMLRLKIFPGPVERHILNVPLNDQQYDDYSATAGMLTKQRLNLLVSRPGFSSLPDGVQSKAINDIMTHSRRLAGDLVKMRNPEILQQAMANKRLIMQEGRGAFRAAQD